MSRWSDHYIGLSYLDLGRDRSGCDCWGLACIVYAQELDIRLPDYIGGYVSTEERAEIAALIGGAMVSPSWQRVQDEPQPFDIALFRRGRLSSHIGVVVRNGRMLHVTEDACSRIENYATGYWAPRLIGHFRHANMVSRGNK